MKFWAKVRLEGEEDAKYLIQAFFKEFNPESSITIKGKEAKLEIFFEGSSPERIISATYHCKVEEFYYGKVLGEYSEDETALAATENEALGQPMLMEVKEEDSEQVEQTTEQETLQQAERPKVISATKKAAEVRTINIPQLEEIVQNATSFEHFVTLVAEWLEMGKRQRIFENLLVTATEIEKVSWKALEKAMKDKGISYKEWDSIFMGRQVSEKLRAYSVTIIPFVKKVAQYKDYPFRPVQPEENSTEQESKEETFSAEEENVGKVEELTSNSRVKMECMPEILRLEETLGSVDKTQPIEDRVKYVLAAMGWTKKNTEEQQVIFEIANAAVRDKEMEFDHIFSKTNIRMEDSEKARMVFSQFINDFVRSYSDRKVKLLDFLKQLQEAVVDKSEI